jgi:hypothetical protein
LGWDFPWNPVAFTKPSSLLRRAIGDRAMVQIIFHHNFLCAHLSPAPFNIIMSKSSGMRINKGRLQAFPGKYRHVFDARLIYRTGDMASGNNKSKSGGLPRMSRTKLSHMQSVPNTRHGAQQESNIQTNARRYMLNPHYHFRHLR